MKLDRALNLVMPVDTEDGVVRVFAEPIDKAAFEANFRLFSKAFAAMYAEGGAITGPRLAALYLRNTAEDMGVPEQGVALMNEIRRRTNIIVQTETGYVNRPFADAIEHKLMDENDISEVEGCLAFFTLAWHMHKRSEVQTHLKGVGTLWGAQFTSSGLTEYRSSLTTSTSGVATTPKVTTVSVPS